MKEAAMAVMAQEARLKIGIGGLLGCEAVMCMQTGYVNRLYEPVVQTGCANRFAIGLRSSI